jgi:hypothetical protein
VAIEKDAVIRAALLPELSTLVSLEDDCVLVEEMGIEHGVSRIDIAVIGSFVHGFEIKAASDSLSRLAHQIIHYDKLVDFAYLVLTENHVESASATTPAHWGVILAFELSDQVQFRILRHATKNPCRVPEALARLLWREEALAALVSLGLDRGFRQKSACILHSRLAASIDLDALSSLVLNQVRQRGVWGERQKQPTVLHAISLAQGNASAR